MEMLNALQQLNIVCCYRLGFRTDPLKAGRNYSRFVGPEVGANVGGAKTLIQ